MRISVVVITTAAAALAATAADARPRVRRPPITVMVSTPAPAAPGVTVDPAARRASFAVVGSRMATFLPGPHLSVTFLGRDVGDDPHDPQGTGAYHATSLVGLVLETGYVVSASELRSLELRSFDADAVRFVATGRGPHWGTVVWYCAAEPSDLDGADRFHAYCTATAPKGAAPWPACDVSVQMLAALGKPWPADQARVDQAVLGRVVMRYRFLDASHDYSAWFSPRRASFDDATPADEPWRAFANGNAFTVETCPIPGARR